MRNERDVFEWRRYGHWRTSAAKARYASYVLWQMRGQSRSAELAAECGHNGGDIDLSLSEAFRRESAVALELVVKAVIVKRRQDRSADPTTEGIPATHDLPKLWLEASLPKLSPDDLFRLQLAKSVLLWAGRYPAPKSVKAWEYETREFDELVAPPRINSKPVFRTPISIGWEDFDRLYQLANKAL